MAVIMGASWGTSKALSERWLLRLPSALRGTEELGAQTRPKMPAGDLHPMEKQHRQIALEQKFGCEVQ